MVGEIIGHYHILEELGRGGMGVVYKAEDIRLKRLVALKFLPMEMTEDSEAKERFIQEARAASAIEHPNICVIHEINETEEGQLYMVMGYYEGETLKERIRRGNIPVSEAIDIAIQIASGLSRAHQKGIIHRDIKPANIIITEDGLVKILDFGIAKLKGKTDITAQDTMVGTINYMSPEQIQGNKVDQRTDIWALGVVLYEMLTGKVPFRGDYEQAIIYSILIEEPEPVSSLQEELPQELEKIVCQALKKEPEQRFQNIEQFLTILRSFQDNNLLEGNRRISMTEKELPSIAVLPFTNISNDPEQEYFCDGVAEEIINALTQIDRLRVVARTSAFAFKGKSLDIREIGKILNVSTILEGSVRKSGNRVRITAQLVNVSDGYHIWSEKFDRDLEDIFTVQDEISQEIVHRLKGKLLGEDKDRLARIPVGDMEAYQLFLKGRYFMYKMTKDNLNKAIDCFKQAIDRLPNFADAHAGIATAFSMHAMMNYLPSKIAWNRAREAALKALAIDRNQASAHLTLGIVKLFQDWDWPGAEKELRIALKLNPYDVRVHTNFAFFYMVKGNMEKALEESRYALQLDPISTVSNLTFAVNLMRANYLKEAEEQIYKLIELLPGHSYGYYLLGQVKILQGKYSEGISHIEELIQRSGKTGLLLSALGWAYGKAGYENKARAILKELESSSHKENFSSIYLVRIYTALKEFDQAFNYLEKAYQERDSELIAIKTEESISDLRSDPRFTQFLKKMGLADV